MFTEVDSSNGVAVAGAQAGDRVRYLTREPILDLRNKVHAYELIFGGGPSAGDREAGVRGLIDNAVVFGLEKLSRGLPAFMKCTAEALTGSLVEMLPANLAVLEVLASAEISAELIAACRGLRQAGYRLALDHFAWSPGVEDLVETVVYAKLDFAQTTPRERSKVFERLRGKTMTLIATNVETQAEFEQARDEGFDLVQGFYFCRPVLVERRNLPPNRISQLEILRLLQDESINLHKLTQLVKRDASLTYRLLRLINSPLCAMQQEVQNVQAALLAVGEKAFRTMATVAIASDLNRGQPIELLRMAFVRGRFCEQAARLCGVDGTEQYLLGLLSLLPAMLRVPMSEVAPLLPLRQEVRRALLGESIAERSLLEWLENYEQGEWEGCHAVAGARNMREDELFSCYQEALAWAESALYFA